MGQFNFLAFERMATKWLSEEINILDWHDAFSNTLRFVVTGTAAVSLTKLNYIRLIKESLRPMIRALINLIASQMLPGRSDQTTLFNTLKTQTVISGFEIIGSLIESGTVLFGIVYTSGKPAPFLRLSTRNVPDILESTMDAVSRNAPQPGCARAINYSSSLR
jgi:hypothetical protein